MRALSDVCGNGIVGFVLAADGQRVVMVCINCGTWYPSAEHDVDRVLLFDSLPQGPDRVLPSIGCSVLFPPARWATGDEVRAFGWGDLIDPQYPDGFPLFDDIELLERVQARLRGEIE
jgi:hypothetical protein